MYDIPYFKELDQFKIFQFLEQYPLALLSGSFKSQIPFGTQVPMIFEERNQKLYFKAHIMRNTEHHKGFSDNPNALAVFTGPNCYVSANWYSNPNSGSTWNYMSVYVTGKIRFMTDHELAEFMKAFTLKFENGNPLSPSIYDNLHENYLNQMMPRIIGLELEVSRFENVFKLSQNRDLESYTQIVAELQKKDGYSALIADEMEKRKPELFK